MFMDSDIRQLQLQQLHGNEKSSSCSHSGFKCTADTAVVKSPTALNAKKRHTLKKNTN